jgi:tetratricopeptide (TPR) repeat protein
MKHILIATLSLLLAARAFAAEPSKPVLVQPADKLDDDLENARKKLMTLEQALRRLRAQQAQLAERQATDRAAQGPAAPAERKDELPDIPAPDKPAGDDMQTGLLLMEMGRFDGALPFLQKAAPAERELGDRAWLLFRTAACLRGLGRNAEAKTVYQQLATSFPDSLWAEEAAWLVKSIEWHEKWRASRSGKASTAPTGQPRKAEKGEAR